MRAIRMERFGGPEVLELVDLPVPVPRDGQVLVRVTRAGVNFADTHQRQDRYLASTRLPLVPGTEVAGVREDTGERVVAMCGTGGYAEYALAPEGLCFGVPDAVSDDAALALLVQGLTAWHLHRVSARLQAGEVVVVHAAAGGVGSLAVQLARPFGAGRVIATASSEGKRALALELGADVALDPDPEGLTERLVEANLGRPVDVVLEMVGGAVFDASLEALAPFGRLVAYGNSSQQANRVGTGALMRTSRAVVGFWLVHALQHPAVAQEALDDLLGRVVEGTLRVVVGGTYPLGEAARAQVDLAERRTTGKLLLDPSA